MSAGTVLLTTSAEERAAPYVEALRVVGVAAERIQVVTPGSGLATDELIAGAAGLVLCGGVDVDPARYGEDMLPNAGVEVLPERDELEWALLAAARTARVPVWGVCRGIQVLNVFLGGSLWQDIPSQLPGSGVHDVAEPRDALVHPVRAEARTPLGELLAREVPFVNSRHHQAIKRTAPGLVPVAFSPEGLVEAVELADGGWWVRGVQWHPEDLVPLAQQRALWEGFAAVCLRREDRE